VEPVEPAEACDDREVEEFERGAVLRGISILDTSSALMVEMPFEAPLAALQPLRRFGWNVGGEATAVIRYGEEGLRAVGCERLREGSTGMVCS